jgi:hypothetical protein
MRQLRRTIRVPTPDDIRVSYGCINVPATFFSAVVPPTVRRKRHDRLCAAGNALDAAEI